MFCSQHGKKVLTLRPLYMKVYYSRETDDNSMKWKDKTIIYTKKKKLLKNKCLEDYKQGTLLLILVSLVQCWKNIKAFHDGKICWKG